MGGNKKMKERVLTMVLMLIGAGVYSLMAIAYNYGQRKFYGLHELGMFEQYLILAKGRHESPNIAHILKLDRFNGNQMKVHLKDKFMNLPP